MLRLRLLLLLAGTLPVTFLVGCGGAGKPVPVSGVLQWEDGSPIPEATITFHPKAEGVRPASGFTGKDGQFELTTLSPGDGAIPGDYVIVVTKSEHTGEAPPMEVGERDPKDLIKAMKGHMAKSKAAGKTGPAIPAAYTKTESTPLKATIEGSVSDMKLKVRKV